MTPSDHRSKAKSMQINIDGIILEDELNNDSAKSKEVIYTEMMLPKVGSKLKN